MNERRGAGGNRPRKVKTGNERGQHSSVSLTDQRRTCLDARRVRAFLSATAGKLQKAAESENPYVLLCALDAVRRAPSMLHSLEVRP